MRYLAWSSVSVAWVSQRLMDQDVELDDEWEGPVVAHAGDD